MQYNLSQEQEILRDTIREFAKTEIEPIASKIDWEARVPDDLLAKLPSIGLTGISIPTDLGGAGADFLSLLIAIEEISKASGSLGSQIALHNAVVCEGFLASSNSELRQCLVPKLASGPFGAFAFDPKSTISCKMEGDEVILDGSTEYIMNASGANVFLVLARLKEGGRILLGFSKDELKSGSELTIGPQRKLLGMRASGTARLEFNKAKLTLNSVLFDPKRTDDALAQLLARSRLAVAANALGIGQAAINAEVKYSNERTQFKTKINSFYAVQDFIATDEVNIQTSRSLTYLVASDIFASQNLRRDSAIAKISSSNSAVQAARHSIRVHGGYGFVRDYPVERYLRDARATQLFVESNESLKAQIAGSLQP